MLFDHQKIKKYLPWFLSILSGIFLALAYPPFSYDKFIWIALLPLMISLWFFAPQNIKIKPHKYFSPNLKKGFWLGYICGFTFFIINLFWLNEVGFAGAILLPAYLAIYFGLFGAFASTVGRPIKKLYKPTENQNVFSINNNIWTSSIHSLKIAFWNSLCWISLEWLRSNMLTGFSWNTLGVALQDGYESLVQICDITGVAGVSFLIVFLSIIWLLTIYRLKNEMHKATFRPHLDFFFAVSLLFVYFFYGINKFKTNKNDNSSFIVKTLCIQPNLSRNEKNNRSLYSKNISSLRNITTTFASSSPNKSNSLYDMIIWPEGAIPGFLFQYENWLTSLVHEVSATIIFSCDSLDRENKEKSKYYNSFVVAENIKNGSILKKQIRHKMHLVPFGEYVPFRFLMPLFKKIAPQLHDGIDFSPGKVAKPIDLEIKKNKFQIIPLICFEDTISSLVTKFITNKPQVIVNLTNDNWFGKSAAAEQHFANARFRTIENRRPLIRCTNTGVTTYINQNGIIVNQLRDPDSNSSFVNGAITFNVKIPKKPIVTFYSLYGKMLSIIIFILTTIHIIYFLCVNKKNYSNINKNTVI